MGLSDKLPDYRLRRPLPAIPPPPDAPTMADLPSSSWEDKAAARLGQPLGLSDPAQAGLSAGLRYGSAPARLIAGSALQSPLPRSASSALSLGSALAGPLPGGTALSLGSALAGPLYDRYAANAAQSGKVPLGNASGSFALTDKTGAPPPAELPQEAPQEAPQAPTVTHVAANNAETVDPNSIREMHAGFGLERAGLEEQKAAVDDKAKAEADALQSRSEGVQKVADAEAYGAQDQRVIADQRKQEFDRNNARIDAMSAELAETPIDHERWWANKSLPQKALSVIATALGGWTSKSGENKAFDQLMGEAHADLQDQQEQYHRNEKRLGDVKSLYAMSYAASGDRAKAMQDANTAMIHGFFTEIDAQAARSGVPSVMANARNAKAELMKFGGKLGREEVAGDIATHKYTAAHDVVTGGAAAAGAGGVGQETGRYNATFTDPFTNKIYAGAQAQVSLASGKMAAAKELRDLARAYEAAHEALSTGDKLKYKAGVVTPAMAKAVDMQTALLGAARKANNDGVYRESEVPLFAKMMSSPDSIVNDNSVMQGHELARQVKSVADAYARSINAHEVSEGSITNRRGEAKNATFRTGATYGSNSDAADGQKGDEGDVEGFQE